MNEIKQRARSREQGAEKAHSAWRRGQNSGDMDKDRNE